MKRFLALFVVLALALSLIPAVALADDAFHKIGTADWEACTAATLAEAIIEAAATTAKVLSINVDTAVPAGTDFSSLNMVIVDNCTVTISAGAVTVGAATAVVTDGMGKIVISGSGAVSGLTDKATYLVAPSNALYNLGSGASMTMKSILAARYNVETIAAVQILLGALEAGTPGALCTDITVDEGTVTMAAVEHALMYSDRLTVAGGAKLIVPASGTLTSYGTSIGDAELIVSGTLENNGTLQTKSDGDITVTSSGVLDNKGTLNAIAGAAGSAAASTEANGAILNNGTLNNTGDIVLPAAASLINGGTLNNNGEVEGTMSNISTLNNYGTMGGIANAGVINTYRGTTGTIVNDGNNAVVNYIDDNVYYKIDIITGKGGYSNPETPTFAVENGSSVPITFYANKGYTLINVLVDGVSMGTISEYTFKNVIANHKIEAVFTDGTVKPPQTGAASLLGLAVMSILGAAGCFVAGRKNK